MFSKKTIFLLSCVLANVIIATELTISFPDTYLVSDALVGTPTGTDNLIAINASDVVLDLGGNVILQGNATANVDGIVISSGVTDVTIKNGIIRGVTGQGLRINPSCARIRLSNISFENCATRGALFFGTGGVIRNIELDNCRFFGCCSSGAADAAVFFTNCSQIQMSNCTVSNITNAAIGINAVNLVNVSLSSFNNLVIQNNSASGFNGISTTACLVNSFVNCIVRNNNATGSGCEGFILGLSAFNNSLVDCIASQNSAVTTCTGFDINSTSTNNILRNCQATLNSGAGVTGFAVVASSENIFIDCTAQGNVANGATPNRAVGFLLNNSSFITMLRALSGFNSALSGTAIGISLETAGNLNNAFIDCIAERNSGSAAATSFGFSRTVGTNNLFTRNVGYSNNTTAGNQLLGFPAGSLSTPVAPASNNIATITGSWTNISAAA